MAHLKIPYNGEELTITEIAKRNKMKPDTLKNRYEKAGNIYQAIADYNNRFPEYKGKRVPLKHIAEQEKCEYKTLLKYFKQTGDIYQAIAKCKKIQEKRDENLIEYNGEELSIYTIAKREKIPANTLISYYTQTGDIYQAIEKYRTKQEQQEEKTIEYNGEQLTLYAIAKKEKLKLDTLKKYYNSTHNIYKAVFMCKILKQKSQTVAIKKGKVDLYDLSIILGIKYSELVNLLKNGLTIEEIKEQYKSKPKQNEKKQRKKDYTVLPNGQSLVEYCVDNGLNYSFIYRAINTYGKTLEEATLEYQNRGSEIPTKWIFEKYGLLLRHLLTSMNIDTNAVVKYMRINYISMSEALEKYIIRRNSKRSNLNGDWMEEVYAFLTDCNMSDQYDEFKRIFFIDDSEERCITQSSSQIASLERKLLLFDIAEVIEKDVFSKNEMPELLQMYEITPEEIDTIFLDLYSKFEDGILLGENEAQMKRRQVLNDIVRKWYFLGQDERIQILSQYQVTDIEQQQIEELSNQIVNHRVMLHIPLTGQAQVVE